jgi:menaquinone-dependent protoporphyrinogen oxidase
MAAEILVTYASRSGSTAEVAEAIGRTLAEGGLKVDVRPMGEVTDLSPYRAVVAGSAIHGNQWLPEAMEFVRAQRQELARRPFACFLVCITMAMRGANRYRAGVSSWLQPVRDLVRPVSEGLFAGRLDFDRLPPCRETRGLRMAVALGIFPRGDRRDWEAVRGWAESLPPLLGG